MKQSSHTVGRLVPGFAERPTADSTTGPASRQSFPHNILVIDEGQSPAQRKLAALTLRLVSVEECHEFDM